MAFLTLRSMSISEKNAPVVEVPGYILYAQRVLAGDIVAAENRKQLVITDRPNPCDYVDGPVRQKNQKSFVGMHPIPILHGCTVGELAQMINGEGWLSNGKKCALTVIPVEGWKHGQPYSLPVKPSPNLPNDQAIALYPSLCLQDVESLLEDPKMERKR